MEDMTWHRYYKFTFTYRKSINNQSHIIEFIEIRLAIIVSKSYDKSKRHFDSIDISRTPSCYAQFSPISITQN